MRRHSLVIPASWPHVVVSNVPLYGNTVSVEAFMRIILSSLPHGRLLLRVPALRPVFQEMVKLLLVQRCGVPYTEQMLELTPATALVGK